MKPELFDGVNCDLAKPKDWNDETMGECASLPVMIIDHDNGQRFIISAWRPSKEDLEVLNSGGLLYLQVYGSMPPVALYTINGENLPNLEP